MRYACIPGISTPASRCVLGTSGIRATDKHRILDAFIASGGNCLDTARVYGGGAAERCVGEWIARARPTDLVIVAKGAHPPNCTPDAIGRELTRTLEILGVDSIQLYMPHRDDPSIPVGEFVDAMEDERAAGRIEAYGASNWSMRRVLEANRYAARRGSHGMRAVSNHFSLARPVEELYPGVAHVLDSDRDCLLRTGIALLPWSAQARGFFADVDSDSLDPNVWRVWGTVHNEARRARARQLAADLGTQAINIALAYVLSQPFPSFPIIGPGSEDELAIALAGLDLTLGPQQCRWLEFGESSGS